MAWEHRLKLPLVYVLTWKQFYGLKKNGNRTTKATNQGIKKYLGGHIREVGYGGAEDLQPLAAI